MSYSKLMLKLRSSRRLNLDSLPNGPNSGLTLGGTPHNPREMREWCLQRDVVIQRINELKAKSREREDVVTVRDNTRGQLSLALVDLGEPHAGENEPFEAVVERAKTFVAERKAEREQRKECDRRIRELELKAA